MKNNLLAKILMFVCVSIVLSTPVFGMSHSSMGGLTMIVYLALVVFWVWMIIDAASRKFEYKILWIVLIVLFGSIAGLVYFFAVRRKLINATKT